MNLPNDKRDQLAEIIGHDSWCHHDLGCCPCTPDMPDCGVWDTVDALAPLLADWLAETRAEALREVANAWTRGEWSNVMLPKPTPPAVPVIAYSNRVGDWLRDRADRIEGGR